VSPSKKSKKAFFDFSNFRSAVWSKVLRMPMNCQRAEVSRLLICRHRNWGCTLVPQIGHNVNICDRAGLWNCALSTIPNSIKIAKLWTTSQPRLTQIYCWAFVHFSAQLIVVNNFRYVFIQKISVDWISF
jgi:hypothetical protein